MFKKSLLSLLLMALMAPWAANAQTTVTIGEGTVTSNTNPFGTYYNYSIAEQLYTADEIGMAGTISSISFYYMGTAAKDFPITVYMKLVDDENLASGGITLADADEVFDGTLSVTTTAGWVTIDLDTPFAYDGTSNLLIGVNKGYVYYFSGQTWQGTATTATMARYTQNDYDEYTTSTVPGTAQANRPNIQMDITPSSGPVCEKPETMEVSDVTTNSAVLTWTSGSGTYNVEYKGGNAADWTTYLSNTTATTANVADLTPGTAYQFRVQSVCGEDVSGWKSVSFSTLFGIPLVEGFGTAIPDGWSMYNGLLGGVLADTIELTATTYAWSFGENAGVFDNHTYVNIYSTSNKWLVMPAVTMEDNVQLQFDLAYTAYTYGSTTTAPQLTGTDDKFVVLVNAGRGWTILRQWDNAGSEYVLNDLGVTPITVRMNLSNYVGQQVAVAFYVESTESNADNNLHIDNVSIDYRAACETPTNLAVNYTGGTSATVTWADADVCELDVNGTPYSNATSPYVIDNLELATVYEVMARQNCGADGYSDWTSPVSFNTDLCLPEDQCEISYELADSWGDGWNSNYINVVDVEEGTILATWTISTGDSASGTLAVCDGREIQFQYVIPGTSTYPGENSWVITDVNGEVIFEYESPSESMSQNYTVSCVITNCKKPTDLTASEIGSRSVELSWTENGEATEWVVRYMPDEERPIEVSATTNPFTLTDLNPSTHYVVTVRPVCSDFDDKWSEEINFTTDVACPVPTSFAVNDITSNSAVLSWNTDASEVGLEYAVIPTRLTPAKSNRGSWLYYDNGINTNSIGTGGSDVYWAVMFPADMLSDNQLSKISVYEDSDNNTEPITIYVYSGGDTAPETLIYEETITTEANEDFHEVILAEPVVFDATQNLWVVLKEYGAYPAQGCANTGDANGRWISLDGVSWDDVTDYGLNYTWMIRAYVEASYDPNDLQWISLGNQTSPYTLTGLDPETTYAVRVKAVCGGEDGESDWTMTTFTTLGLCDVPSNLEVTDLLADAATLNWIGSQDSYNVRYRSTGYFDDSNPLYFEGFEDGIPSTWTTIDNDTTTIGNWLALSEIPTTYSYYAEMDLSNWAHSGSNAAASGSYVNGVGAVATDQYLVTSQLTVNGEWLRFFATSTYSDPDSYEVLFSTTGNNISDFTITLQAMGPATYNSWDEVLIDMSDYVGQQGYVAIHHVSTDKYFLVIDDFGIYGQDAVVAAGSWVNITNTVSPKPITGLALETEYEWQVQGINANCQGGVTAWTELATFTSHDGLIFNADGNWNDANNWYLGAVPAEGKSVVIAANAIIPADYDANVDEIEILEGGSLTIQDGGQLHSNVEVVATVQKNITGYGEGEGNWYLISAPFRANTSTTEGTNLLDGDVDFYGYAATEDGEEWQNHKTTAIGTMVNGKGYLYANMADGIIEFTGTVAPQLESGYIGFLNGGTNSSTYCLSYDADTTLNYNWNLVGNNFPHDGYVYLAQYSGSSLYVYGTDYYKMNQDGTDIIISDESVKVGEGIFILSTDASQYAIFSRSRFNTKSGAVCVNVVKDNSLLDKVVVRFGEGTNIGKLQLNPKHTKIYMPLDSKEYAVRFSEARQDKMPVSFKAEKDGDYTLNLTTENMEFSYLHLIDTMTNTEVDLLANPEYTFKAKAGENASRFILVYEVK